MSLPERRDHAKELVGHGVSVRQACEAMKVSNSSYYYQALEKDDGSIKQVLLNQVKEHPGQGFDKMLDVLRETGSLPCGKTRLWRVYHELGLVMNQRPKQRLPAREKIALTVPQGPNQMWSLDFMSDALRLGNGRSRVFRTLNVIDDYSRSVLGIEIDSSLPSVKVVEVLSRLVAEQGKPACIRSDNGPEFRSERVQAWAREMQIAWRFIQPGKPTQNAFIERFNRSYRTEVLDVYWFSSLDEVREITWRWREFYNIHRPHDALNGQTPARFAGLSLALVA